MVSTIFTGQDMERVQHIEMLKKLIEQNEKNLAELKALVTDLEDRRTDSMERHKDRSNGNGQERSLAS